MNKANRIKFIIALLSKKIIFNFIELLILVLLLLSELSVNLVK
jgi:hypothetical protein